MPGGTSRPAYRLAQWIGYQPIPYYRTIPGLRLRNTRTLSNPNRSGRTDTPNEGN
jgi:hypothetical protein